MPKEPLAGNKTQQWLYRSLVIAAAHAGHFTCEQGTPC
jgi:hypothetical protein